MSESTSENYTLRAGSTAHDPHVILFLVWVHGFKGDETSFLDFPNDLTAYLRATHPRLDVRHEIYPKYRTTGELYDCTASFVRWVRRRVAVLRGENESESENEMGGEGDVSERGRGGGGLGGMASTGTASASDGDVSSEAQQTETELVDVRVVLLGHSMGGLLVADAAILLNTPYDPDNPPRPPRPSREEVELAKKAKKAEEKELRAQEKAAEKERKEQNKVAEKERKEREKADAKARKEREKQAKRERKAGKVASGEGEDKGQEVDVKGDEDDGGTRDKDENPVEDGSRSSSLHTRAVSPTADGEGANPSNASPADRRRAERTPSIAIRVDDASDDENEHKSDSHASAALGGTIDAVRDVDTGSVSADDASEGDLDTPSIHPYAGSQVSLQEPLRDGVPVGWRRKGAGVLVSAVIALDTPFIGVHPSLVAYGIAQLDAMVEKAFVNTNDFFSRQPAPIQRAWRDSGMERLSRTLPSHVGVVKHGGALDRGVSWWLGIPAQGKEGWGGKAVGRLTREWGQGSGKVERMQGDEEELRRFASLQSSSGSIRSGMLVGVDDTPRVSRQASERSEVSTAGSPGPPPPLPLRRPVSMDGKSLPPPLPPRRPSSTTDTSVPPPLTHCDTEPPSESGPSDPSIRSAQSSPSPSPSPSLPDDTAPHTTGTKQEKRKKNWKWLNEHLVFMASLWHLDGVTRRMREMDRLQKEDGMVFVNFYTVVPASSRSNALGGARTKTFISLPSQQHPTRDSWRAFNIDVPDQVEAHMALFMKDKNTSYGVLMEQIGEQVVQSVDAGA